MTRDQQKNLEAGQDHELLKKPVVIDATKCAADVPVATALARLHMTLNTTLQTNTKDGRGREAAIDRAAVELADKSTVAMLGLDKDGEELVAATVTLKATGDRTNFDIAKPTNAPADKRIVVDRAECTTQIGRAKDDMAAGDRTTVGQDNAGVGALEYAASSGSKAVNIEVAPEALTSTSALTTKLIELQLMLGFQWLEVLGRQGNLLKFQQLCYKQQ